MKGYSIRVALFNYFRNKQPAYPLPRLILLALTICYSQGIIGQSLKLAYKEHVVLTESMAQVNRIGGLSGITFNPTTNSYLTCADKPPARFLKFTVSDRGKINNPENILLRPSILSSSELEGIVFDPLSRGYFVTDEQEAGSRIFQIDSSGNFKEVLLPKNKAFLSLSAPNSGIEGLSLRGDGITLYFAFERPTETCFDQSITTIGKLDLQANSLSLYPYRLHKVADDKLNTNGISEIIWLAEERLLVMERAYLPGKGNIVRLYETELTKTINSSENPINCSTPFSKIAKTKLVFDFSSIDDFNVDNAEGMTFNEDRSQLLIITDNNFNARQETQLISLDVHWQLKDSR